MFDTVHWGGSPVPKRLERWGFSYYRPHRGTPPPPPPQNGSTSINLDQHEYTYSAVARTLTYCCTHDILAHALYTGARKPVESERI